MGKLTYGQAILKLLENLKDQIKIVHSVMDREFYNSLKNDLEYLEKLYLCGCQTTEDRKRLDQYIQKGKHEGIIEDVLITSDPDDINDDLSRRYFETQLAVETLRVHTQNLSLTWLHAQCEQIKNLAAKYFDVSKELKILMGEKTAHECSDIEFSSVMKSILEENFFVNPEDKTSAINKNCNRDKLILIMQMLFLGMAWCSERDKEKNPLPIAIYNKDFFKSVNRGRVDKYTPHKEDSDDDEDEARERRYQKRKDFRRKSSCHRGIFTTTSPVPYYDDDAMGSVLNFWRGPNRMDFEIKAAWPKFNFDKLVHPFITSISGTALIFFRVLKELQNITKAPVDQNEIAQVIRCYAALSLYLTGGHSIHEYMSVSNLKEVREAFPIFNSGENLLFYFYEDNRHAFSKALDKTIEYNKRISLRNNLHVELTNCTSFFKKQLYHATELEMCKSLVNSYKNERKHLPLSKFESFIRSQGDVWNKEIWEKIDQFITSEIIDMLGRDSRNHKKVEHILNLSQAKNFTLNLLSKFSEKDIYSSKIYSC